MTDTVHQIELDAVKAPVGELATRAAVQADRDQHAAILSGA